MTKNNIFLVITTFIKENKFDEDFGVGSINPSSEETELLLRAYYKKYTIGFIDKTLCSTEIKDIIATDYKKIISYAFGLKEVLFKYKSLLPKTYYLYIKFKPLLSSLKYIFTQHALSKRLLVIFFVNIIGTEKRINKYV